MYRKYGEEYVVSQPRFYRNTSKVQDAHEAIRPTFFNEYHTPEQIAQTENLDPEEDKDLLKLYEFIWYRTLATQMKPAIYDFQY